MSAATVLQWFAGGDQPYHKLFNCMHRDTLWVSITVALDLTVALGYVVIAKHWWQNERLLPPTPAKRSMGAIRSIFLFCGLCGYVFIPIKMFWPAWRLYDFVMVGLAYFTWRYAWGAKDLKVVYNELGRSNRLAEDLEKSREESRQKGFFLNAISHDMRTPLNDLLLHANLAEMGMDSGDTETVRESVREMMSGARSAAGLLDNLLEYARLEWSEVKPANAVFAMCDVVESVCSRMSAEAKTKGLDLTWRCPAGLRVNADRSMLERVLANLVQNAVKFTERGSVRVEVDFGRTGVELHVIDTGVGISNEHLERLFEEFYQVRNYERDGHKGFGLGLAIVRGLVRQMGGDVAVQSSAGHGSRFTVILPGVRVADEEGVAKGRAVVK